MSQQESEQELIALEHAWLEAMKRKDMATVEQLVGQEFTLTANGLPQNRLTRTQWIATVPVLDIQGYGFQQVVVHVYADAAVVLAELEMQATIAGSDRSGHFVLTDTWVKRDGRWQVVARGSIFTPRSS